MATDIRQAFSDAEQAFRKASGLSVLERDVPPRIRPLDIFRFESGIFYQVTRVEGGHVYARAVETMGAEPSLCRFLEHAAEEQMVTWGDDQIASFDSRSARVATRVYTRTQTLAALFKITSLAKAKTQIL